MSMSIHYQTFPKTTRMWSEGNWCKLAFVLLSSSHLFMLILFHIFEPYLPSFILNLMRYGKLVSEKQKNGLQLQKSYFKHFYVLAAFVYVPVGITQILSAYWLKQEVPQWFIHLLNVCCGSKRVATVSSAHSTVALLLMSLQIWRRFYDTHFVSVFSKNAHVHLSQYIMGLMYYAGTILIILSEAPKFTRTTSENENFNLTDFTPIDIIAAILFLWAWYHQHTTTIILANLRKNKKGDVVTENYKIPQGDWFKYLSSPHCTAEILMYLSIWIILGIKHSWWCVCFLVLINQVDSIITGHRWYQTHFKDFPRERKALIPLIF